MLSLAAALALSAVSPEETLPRRIGDELLPALQQGGRRREPPRPPRPFLDFENSEIGGWLGFAQFSGEFDADPSFAAGATFRVPLGKLGHAGLWGELLASSIDRDLDAQLYDTLDGTIFGVAAGVDYGLVDNESWFLRPQVGFAFLSFGDVEGTDDGLGLVLGAHIGVYWVRLRQNVCLGYNPQWFFDGEDWVIFHAVGITVGF